MSDTGSFSEDRETRKKPPEKPKPPFHGFGILCAVLAASVYSINSMLVKLVTSVGSMQLIQGRCFVSFVLILPYVTYSWKKNNVDFLGPPGMFKFLLLRALTGSTATILLYQAIHLLSLVDAVTLQFTNVIFAAIIAYFALGEALTMLDGAMSILTIAGVILISKPTFIFGGLGVVAPNSVGIILGVLSGFMNASTVVFLRRLGKNTHPLLNILYYSLIGGLTSTCYVGASGEFQFPCVLDLPYMVLLGVTGIVAQVLLNVAIHYERAATVTVTKSIQIVLVLILQVVVLHDRPTTLSLIGCGLIFVSVFAIALRKLYNKKTKTST